MATNNEEPDLAKTPMPIATPFTLAARSIASSKPANATRNRATRRGPQSPKKRKERRNPQPQQPSSNDTQLIEIPIMVSDNRLEEEDISEESDEEDSVQIPDSGSSFSQASQVLSVSSSGPVSSFKRPRTSTIYQYVTRRGDILECSKCSKTYQVSGGTGAITRHLKLKHQIDATPSGVAEKRQKEGTAIDAAILRGAERNIKAQQERRRELMGIGLDKATLEYLYLQWTISMNISFKQVRDSRFRTFLEYVNPVANRMLPDSDLTIKVHAEGLFAEGKQRLHHMLATTLSDIHITCDMWTSPNNLGLLAVVGHFTSEKSKLHSITLGLVELRGGHSGLNQATAILNILDDYGIRNKLGYLVMDNASSNDTLIEVIASTLCDQGVQYDAEQRRLRCNGHVINLAVQAFLFGKTVDDYEYLENSAVSPSDEVLNQWRKLGPLGKLHNMLYFVQSANRPRQAATFY